MKKFSKILLVILSVLALVAVMAFAISATDESVEGQFAVRDADGTLKGYATWAEAIEAAKTAGNYTITVNDDWTISETANDPKATDFVGFVATSGKDYLSTSSEVAGDYFYTFKDGNDWTLDLNGKTVNVNMDGVLFYAWNTDLTITGGGTINNARGIARINSNSNVTVAATSPITVNPVAHAVDAESVVTQQGRWVLFTLNNDNTTLNLKGKININPVDAGMLIIDAVNAKEVNLDFADITIGKPSSSVTTALSEFIRANDKGLTTVNINSSKVDLKFGRMFYTQANQGNRVDLTGWLDHFPVVKDAAAELPATMASDIDKYIENVKTNNITINANNSTFISDPCTEYKSGVINNQGTFLRTDQALVFANFNNCDISASSRSIWGHDGSIPGTKDSTNLALGEGEDYVYVAAANQLYFKDCDFTYLDNPGQRSFIFMYCTNVIWDGGSINLNTASGVSTCGYFYDKPVADKDFFYGLKFSNVLLSKKVVPTAIPADVSTTTGNAWKSHYTNDGTMYDNYAVVENGALVSYAAAVSDTPPALGGAIFASGATADYESKVVANADGVITDLTTKGTNDYKDFIQGAGDFSGILSEKTLDNGNIVLDISYTEDVAADGKYFQLKYQSAYVGMENKYSIYEFDIASNKWPATGFTFYPQNRIQNQCYDASGNYLGRSATEYVSNVTRFIIKKDGTIEGTSTVLPADGTWTRITLVQEWRVGEAQKHSVPAYLNQKDSNGNYLPDGTKTVELDCVPVSTFYHCYANGEYLYSAEVKLGYSGWIPVNSDLYTKNAVWIDGWRIQHNDKSNAGTGVMFDNMTAYLIPANSTIDLSSYFHPGKNIAGAPIGNSGAKFNMLPSANDYGKPATEPDYVAKVDGVGYMTEAELAAAVKDGSTVELLKDGTMLNISGKSLLVKDNGHTYKLISADKKLVDYTASLGGLLTVDAPESEIATIDFEYDEYGLKQVKAVLGTYVEIPSTYDPESADFIVESVEKGDGETTVTYDNLVGWTLGGSAELIATKGVTKATPVIKSEEAVWVYWNIYGVDKPTEDDIIAYYYNPALNLKGIPANDIEEYEGAGAGVWTKDASGWYETMPAFDQEFIETVDLSVPGKEYNVPISVTKRAWVEMYANVTLRTFFRLNFYIPDTAAATKAGVSEVTVTSDGGDIVAYGTDTVGSKTCARYGICVGTTDTTAFEVTVTYKVEGESAPFTFTANYGMPDYAEAIMAGEKYSDSAKSLVMNIVNYADKNIAIAGKAANERYTKLLADNAKYLDGYNGLTNDKFAVGGSIYTNEIAPLLTEDNTGAKYFSGASVLFSAYEPTFMFKFSDEAEKVGIAKPNNNNGFVGWGSSSTAAGLTAEYGVGTSDSWYASHYAAANGTDSYIKNNSHEAWNMSNSASYDYYVVTKTYYTDPLYPVNSWVQNGLPTMSDFAGNIHIKLYKDKAAVATYEYNLATYISSLIEANAAKAEIELAKAMYSLAKAAYDYKGDY